MAKTHALVRPGLASLANYSLSTWIQVVGASLFIAICAQIKIPLFFTPVPLTFQTLSVLLVAGFLGGQKGSMSVLLYIAEGCIGLPFFTGGNSGILYFFGPTGGYLIGCVIQAYIVGWFSEKKSSVSSARMLAIILFSCLIQLSVGMIWLAKYVGWNQVLLMGFYPFIPGEILKSMGAVRIGRLLK